MVRCVVRQTIDWSLLERIVWPNRTFASKSNAQTGAEHGALGGVFIAGLKGLAAGIVNVVIALALGARLPAMPVVGMAMTVGLLGYGISLVLFVLALRGLGSARTGAYFSTAPFIGAGESIVFTHSKRSQ